MGFEVELIIKYQAKELGLENNWDVVAVQSQVWVAMYISPGAKVHANSFGPRETESVSVSPMLDLIEAILHQSLNRSHVP